MVPLIGVLLFLAALWVLHDEIAEISIAELRHVLREIPASSLLLACLAVFANYGVLTLSDAIAVRQSGARIAVRNFPNYWIIIHPSQPANQQFCGLERAASPVVE